MGEGETRVRGFMKSFMHWIGRNPDWHNDVIAWMQTEKGESVIEGLFEAAYTSQYLGAMTLSAISYEAPPENFDEKLGYFRRLAYLQTAVSIDDYVANSAPKFSAGNSRRDVSRAAEMLRRYLSGAERRGCVLRDQQLIQLTPLGVQYFFLYEEMRQEN